MLSFSMRLVLLVFGVLLLVGCSHFAELPGRKIVNGHCTALIVENRQFADATIYLENTRRRVGFASGLTTTSFQMCHLTHETASLVVAPIGARSFAVRFPVSPVGARVVRLTIGGTPVHSTMEIF